MDIIIKDNNDFNRLLSSIMNEETTIENDICLISQDKLENVHITLECGHKFNYSSIFECVYREKIEHQNHFETTKLKMNQIRCPYCRQIQDKLLPPCESYRNIRYVNYPTKYCMKTHECIYMYKNGKKKNTACKEICSYGNSYCKKHSKYKEQVRKKKCTFILIRGKNKGKECGCNVYKDSLCKRHYY